MAAGHCQICPFKKADTGERGWWRKRGTIEDTRKNRRFEVVQSDPLQTQNVKIQDSGGKKVQKSRNNSEQQRGEKTLVHATRVA